MYSMVGRGAVRFCSDQARIRESWRCSRRSNSESKMQACSRQALFFVNAARGESAAGDMPARKRAVSFADTVSVARAGANPSRSAQAAAATKVLRGGICPSSRWCCKTRNSPLLREIVQRNSRDHQQDPDERLQRTLRHEVIHHKPRDREKDEWRDRVPPGAIRARQVRPGDAQLDQAEHCKKRAGQQTELDEVEDCLEALGEEHQRRDH